MDDLVSSSLVRIRFRLPHFTSLHVYLLTYT